LFDLHQRVSHSRQRIGIVVGLDYLEGVEGGIAGEKTDQFGEAKIVSS
jgi:hypothetical protein